MLAIVKKDKVELAFVFSFFARNSTEKEKGRIEFRYDKSKMLSKTKASVAKMKKRNAISWNCGTTKKRFIDSEFERLKIV